MNHRVYSDADRLLLDAKKTLLQEHHRRFQELHQQGRWDEAVKQLNITLSCAADLLKDSVTLLERVVAHQRQQQLPPRDNE